MTDPLRGRTMRWSFVDGAMKGKTYEHVFANDGTVTYREWDGKPAAAGGEPGVKYEYARVNDDVSVVSYLSSHGYTLTTVLDAKSRTLVGFASNEKELSVHHGTFEEAKAAR